MRLGVPKDALAVLRAPTRSRDLLDVMGMVADVQGTEVSWRAVNGPGGSLWYVIIPAPGELS